MSRRKPWEVSDELWAVIEPLLPKHERRFRHPGRKRIDDRRTLQGVLFVLYTGIQWEYLPQELGFGSGPTCWRRLAEWQEAGVWEELQQVLLDRLRAADRLDFSRATIDASHVQAKRGRSSPKVGPSPVDRARPGSKHHVLTEAHGIPLRVSLTGGHRNDVTQLLPLVDSIGPVRGKRGRPRRKPRTVYADRGYDHEVSRRRLRERGIVAGGEFLYLATVLDCFSRKVVGWSIADHMRTSLVADALQMAAATRGGLDGAVFHSDHGAQYGSRAFADLCDQLGVTRSMGAVGTSADNVACESFHASLKRETLQAARDYGDASTCRRTVFAWLARYNTRRRHSANGHLSPNEYERRHHAAKLTLAA